MILRKTNNEAMNGECKEYTPLPLRCTMKRRAVNRRAQHAGFSLLELVVTLTVLTIMTLGVIPLIKTSVKRQREQQLREELREMREAIKQFHRDTIGCPNSATGTSQIQVRENQIGNNGGQPQPIDPRSRVCISDQTIFTVDNTERYPPTLEALKDGVDVLPRLQPSANTFGSTTGNVTETNKLQTTPKKKVYLREIPVDPMTGKADWELRSVYDSADAASWGSENVFDVHSKSNATSLNGEKYSEW